MNPTESKRLCDKVLKNQPGAAEELFSRCEPVVRRALISRCMEGRSRCEAEDIAEDVIADCFRIESEQNLLRYYSGRIPLESWLVKVAMNRLKNWWRSGRYTYERQGGDGGDVGSRAAGPDSGEEPGDREVYDALGDALLAACRGIKPRELAMLRAYYLQGILQVDIAARWGCSPATVGRKLRKTVAAIREGMERYLEEWDTAVTVTWEDLLATSAFFPEILVGFDARPGR